MEIWKISVGIHGAASFFFFFNVLYLKADSTLCKSTIAVYTAFLTEINKKVLIL